MPVKMLLVVVYGWRIEEQGMKIVVETETTPSIMSWSGVDEPLAWRKA
jgi:hypothetical protein